MRRPRRPKPLAHDAQRGRPWVFPGAALCVCLGTALGARGPLEDFCSCHPISGGLTASKRGAVTCDVTLGQRVLEQRSTIVAKSNSARRIHRAGIGAVMVVGLLSLGVLPAMAATESCTYHFSNHSDGTIVTKTSGGTYGSCASVQARTYFYYGGGWYGWETGPTQSVLHAYSAAINSSANSVQTRNARVKPITTWSTWIDAGTTGSKNRSVTT